MAERTQVRQYGSNSKSLRLGWRQEWGLSVSSHLSLNIIKRDYKDVAKILIYSPSAKIVKTRYMT